MQSIIQVKLKHFRELHLNIPKLNAAKNANRSEVCYYESMIKVSERKDMYTVKIIPNSKWPSMVL